MSSYRDHWAVVSCASAHYLKSYWHHLSCCRHCLRTLLLHKVGTASAHALFLWWSPCLCTVILKAVYCAAAALLTQLLYAYHVFVHYVYTVLYRVTHGHFILSERHWKQRWSAVVLSTTTTLGEHCCWYFHDHAPNCVLVASAIFTV
jgi:hypothetical protein